MAAVTVTAVQVRTLPTTGETKLSPEYELVVDDKTVAAISEYVNPNTKSVDNNYSVIYIGGLSITCKHTLAELQALFPMT